MEWRDRNFIVRAAGLVVAAVGGGAIALGGAAALGRLGGEGTTTVRPLQAPSSPSAPTVFRGQAGSALSINQIFQRSAPGVVQVTSTSVVQSAPALDPSALDPFADPFGTPPTQEQRSLGSGFVVDKAGHIITNYHVVADSTKVDVSFSSNESLNAKVVGIDPSTDLAVLKVNARSRALTPLQLGDSDTVSVGDAVVAIGNPFGLDRTVTAGIVSALQRQIEAPNRYSIDHVIQTDAPINQGNSGGPLLNTHGQVIGVNAQISTGETGTRGNVGIGFAIPINTVKSVAAQIIQHGEVEHAFIGITAHAINATLARSYRLPVSRGLLIETVQPRSGAAKAGVKGGSTQVTVAGETYLLGGDVLVRADGTRVSSLSRLRELVAAKKPGDTMKLEVYRGSKKLTLTVTLGRLPNSPPG
jgi:S1-C subfamily serine protease